MGGPRVWLGTMGVIPRFRGVHPAGTESVRSVNRRWKDPRASLTKVLETIVVSLSTALVFEKFSCSGAPGSAPPIGVLNCAVRGSELYRKRMASVFFGLIR